MELEYKTSRDTSPQKKPKVYFTCHPDDFDRSFEKIRKDIAKTHDCVILYTKDMTESYDEKYIDADLKNMNLFVIPVTHKLLEEPNRAMDVDLPYAKKEGIPVLPVMLESGINDIYSKPDKFGDLQFVNPYSNDITEIVYEEKLKKFLNSVLLSDEMARRVRAAFDAYIFLSYRKKDRHHANELMRLIHAKPEFHDIAIWYDEFLIPGESFNDNIAKMLNDSKLFALLVTPNLLEEPGGKPNFVMGMEYPMAKKNGMNILPAEMEKTDKKELSRKFKDVPECVDPHDDEVFKARLLKTITRVATADNNDEPEHNFLIGIAFLEGIDVEVNRERGLDLIIKAAEAGLPDALRKLYDLQLLAYEFSDFLIYNKISYILPKLEQIDPEYYVRAEILRAEQLYSDYKKFEEAIEIFDNIAKKFGHILKSCDDIYISFEINQIFILHEYYKNNTEALKRINVLFESEKIGEELTDEKDLCQKISKLYYHKSVIEYRIGDYKNCIKSCQKALELSVYGYDNPDRLKSLIYIISGSCYLKAKDFERALSDFNESLNMRIGLYGEYNLYVANSYNNLVKAYYRKALYTKCDIDDLVEEYLTRWKKSIEKTVGKVSINMAYCYYWEAKIRKYQERDKLAAECASKALEMDKKFKDFSCREAEEMIELSQAKY